ncbi:MAG: ribosome biogenesis GTPase RsgA, partial [Magnetococcales bacterium]|nr:ribosome biogenesis GTPase RsgA [Magnetococcales bacterium]
CQFTDCGHLNEPGCKVVRAVKKGYVDMRRFESMHRIMESMQEM